jgi:tRNA-2-methylthio-N6-dimethylallyladenosine synthase
MSRTLNYRFCIETVGCQMNVLDSEIAAASLVRAGLEQVDDTKNADVIIFKTCSIRQHAEEKEYSALGRLKHWKTALKPRGVIGIMGCMAQKDQHLIFRRAPFVDFILGPGSLDSLANTVVHFLDEKQNGHITETAMFLGLNRSANRSIDVAESFRLYDPQRISEVRPNPYQAMVRIMFGCDKFCSYCIVPSVRGPEQSRPPKSIIDEVKMLVEQGVKEITLIGQTVNSYKYNEDGETVHLSDLLYRLSGIDGLHRIRFVSNYPTGMTDELLQAVRDLPKVMEHIHVPAQSGSDTVLKRMRRQYTVSEYKEMIDRIYGTIPDASITSDFIVGFCGETDDEFQATADLVRFGRFKNSFIFKFSERPGTKAAELYADDISDEVKKQRNNELLDIQNGISLELNRNLTGKTKSILVEGISKRYENIDTVQLCGRTPCDRIVVFDSPDEKPVGQILDVVIENAAPFTLFGKVNSAGLEVL